MAEPLFSLRGNSLTPRRNLGAPRGFAAVSSTIASAANSDTDNLSGGLINFTNGTANKALIFSGRKNTPDNRAFSILMRVKMAYTGAPAGNRGYITLGNLNGVGPVLMFWHSVTTGNITVVMRRQTNNSSCLNSVSFGAWTTNNTGDYVDLFFSWDGTTTANAAKFYINGTLLGQATATNAAEATWYSEYFGTIAVGLAVSATTSNFSLDELCIWDGVVDPTAIVLDDETGALDGPARTGLVTATAFDGSVNTSAGAANIRSGSTEVINGVTTTGTCAVPTAANTLLGVSVDATTGTYRGPAVDKVESGYAYGASDALTGTNLGGGVNSDPGVDKVVAGTVYKVQSATNNRTGTYVVTDPAVVLKDIDFGAAGAETGTLSVVPPTVIVLPLG